MKKFLNKNAESLVAVYAILKDKKTGKGITLISLIVTIIVLLILAGISISLIAGGNGILGKASSAVDTNEKATATEELELKITYLNMESYGEHTRKATLQELAEGLFVDKEIDYVKIKEQKVASLEEINVTGENSIFVKLTKYPYEFEINSDLHLASVDGVKVENESETVTISKEEYENLKPNPITEDSLLFTSANTNLGVGTFNLSNFTHTYGNGFENYFSLDEATGELTCKKSGWYNLSLRIYLNSAYGNYTGTSFEAKVNGVQCIYLYGDVDGASHTESDTDTFTLFLNNNDKIIFNKVTTNSSAQHHNSAIIKIFKL